MEDLNRLVGLLSFLNYCDGRYQADFDVSKNSIRAKIYRNDDGVTVLTIDTDSSDADHPIEIKASIAYLEVLKDNQHV